MQWRALGLAACVVAACRRAPERTPKPAPSVTATTPATAALLASALAVARAKLSLAAPTWQPQPFAFGQHLFAALGTDSVSAFSLPDGALLLEEPLPSPRGVVALAGGSLFVAGGAASLRLDPNAKKPVRLPAIPWLPGTFLVPERRDSSFVWAVQPRGGLLVKQRLDLDPTRGFGDSITLEGYEGGALTVLRDGALLFRANDGVRRALPESRPRSLKTALDVWRLLPGRRVDQAWAIAPDGSVELWLIGERLLVQKRFAAGAAPFDAAASGDYLGLVVVDEPGDAPRRFRLLVFDNEGSRVLERALPPGPPESGRDWELRATENRHLALADGEPFVAIGGPGRIEVLTLPGGERLLPR